ncbi:type 4a pilus biogenesis protein PilO [Kineococcus sp. SYSU DK003]|uniref:type 4a pilus biogenesis protein PilO n=1 Tax=Kineococcus sp. SYSU DK003 TaxID=3383124 RepID=UPI003D7ED018
MTSSKNTLWIAGTGVLAVLIVVASYFLLIAPKRAQAADTLTTAAGVEQSNATLAAETERLKAQFATIDEQRAHFEEIKAELPDGSQIPALIRQFTTFATGAGVTVTDIAPGALTEYVSSTSAATATDMTATDPTAEDTTAATSAVASGISYLPVSVTVEGSFAGAELFVKNLQADMQRYLLVDSVSLVREDTSVATTITGNIFVLADATADPADAPATSSATTAASAASTSTGTVN